MEKSKIYVIEKKGTFCFDNPALFYDGLAKIVLGGKVGFLKQDGTLLTGVVYESLGDFSDGLCAVYQGEKWGYIDRNGILVLDIIYENVGDFIDGRACVKLKNDFVYIDTEGNILESIHGEDIKTISRMNAERREEVLYIYDSVAKKGLTAIIGEKWFELDKQGIPYSPRETFEFIEGGAEDIEYEEEEEFEDESDLGLLKVMENDKWGIISEERDLLVEPKFDEIGESYMNHIDDVLVEVKRDKYWGLLLIEEGTSANKIIKVFIEPKYDEIIGDFESNNSFFYTKRKEKTGLVVNNDYSEMIDTLYDEIEVDWKLSYRDDCWGKYSTESWDDIEDNYDFILVNLEEQGLGIYSFFSGNIIYEACLDDFLGMVDVYDDYFGIKLNGKWGAIDNLGNRVIEPIYMTSEEMMEVLALRAERFSKIECRNEFSDVRKDIIPHQSGDKYGYAGLGQTMRRDLKIDSPERNYSEGLLPVQLLSEKWGYVDAKGLLVLDGLYDVAGDFKNGIAVVELPGKRSFIDKKGRLSENISDDIANENVVKESFLIKVDQSGKWGYQDMQGQWVISPQFEKAECFINEMAVVGLDGKYGIIDKDGNWVLDIKYLELIYGKHGMGVLAKDEDVSSQRWQYLILKKMASES
jgi:hypothetical protein